MTNEELCRRLAAYPQEAEVAVYLDRYERRDCERCGQAVWLVLDGGYAVRGIQPEAVGRREDVTAVLLLEVGEPL